MSQRKTLRTLVLVAVPLVLYGYVTRVLARRPWTLPQEVMGAQVFSPDGRWLATADFEHVWRWDRRTHERKVVLEPPSVAAVTGMFWGVLAVSPDSQTLAYHSSLDHSIKLLPVTAGSQAQTPKPQTLRYGSIPTSDESGPETLLFSSDGHLLVMAESENIRVWDVQAKTPRLLWQRAFPATIQNGVVTFFRGSRVLLLPRDLGGSLCDARTGKTLRTLPFHARADDVAVTPDGTVRASSHKQVIEISDVVSGRLLERILCPHLVGRLCFSHDGKLLAAGSADHGIGDTSVTIWRVATGALVRTLRTGTEYMALQFAPAGDALAVASNDWRVRVWPLP